MNDAEIPRDVLDTLPQPLRADCSARWTDFSKANRELAASLRGDPLRFAQLLRVWALSDFAARSCLRYPDMLADLLASGDLDSGCDRVSMAERLHRALSGCDGQQALKVRLRACRRREMVRIAWRDLCGIVELEDILAELTWLAEILTDLALERLRHWQVERHGIPRDAQGRPQQMVVLGMGKLGGGELNYSSDIDLIFAYPAPGASDGARPVDCEAFFRTLGQQLIRVLAEVTEDGFVYRVDMRLRPFGESGPLAMPVMAMEHYYQTHGREWERYALIKARPVAGELALGERLLETLRPFVYRRYLDYGAIDALRGMKAMISREVERKGLRRNIKLGPGGIREIEFIVQAFQLIHGGRRPQLRQRSLMSVLKVLERDGDLPADAVAVLADGYRFLRATENRLQAWADRQTHDLPEDDLAKQRLAWAMGFDAWRDFVAALMSRVRAIEAQFDLLFGVPESDADDSGSSNELAAVWSDTGGDSAPAILSELGYAHPAEVSAALKSFRDGFVFRALTSEARQRLDRLMPLLLTAAAATDEPQQSLMRALRLVETVARRSSYLSLLAEKPLALSQLMKLCSASPWISEFLRKHPLLLDELLSPATLYEPLHPDALEHELQLFMERVPVDDLEQQMDMLRHFQQTQVLRVAAADIAGTLRLMVVSDGLTWIAEAVIKRALHIAWGEVLRRYGKPGCTVDGVSHRPDFCVVAYGKLGGIELGYGSDLDLVFLHDSGGQQQRTEGPRQLDNATFFARLAQRMINIITARTPAGVLYEVDTRLRPGGHSGLLVLSVDAFAEYQRQRAWTWEHQALVRARPVAGATHIADRFEALRREILCRSRDPQELRVEVVEMRERMRSELGAANAAGFHLKQGPGGIADIEFMVQYEVLAKAGDYPALTTWSDNIRQLDALEEVGVLGQGDAALLRDAYRALRRQVHRRRLQDQGSLCPEPELDPELIRYREGVVGLWRQLMIP